MWSEDVDSVLEMWERGRGIGQIALELDLDPTEVRRVLMEQGFEVPTDLDQRYGLERWYVYDNMREMREDYMDENTSRGDFTKKWNMSYESWMAGMRELGLETREMLERGQDRG